MRKKRSKNIVCRFYFWFPFFWWTQFVFVFFSFCFVFSSWLLVGIPHPNVYCFVEAKKNIWKLHCSHSNAKKQFSIDFKKSMVHEWFDGVLLPQPNILACPEQQQQKKKCLCVRAFCKLATASNILSVAVSRCMKHSREFFFCCSQDPFIR